MALAGARWGAQGISCAQFQCEGEWALTSFGETAVGLAHAEKRKSEVCPWGGSEGPGAGTKSGGLGP